MTDEKKRAFLKDRIVDQMTLFLMRDFNLRLPDALEVIYNSALHLSLQNDDCYPLLYNTFSIFTTVIVANYADFLEKLPVFLPIYQSEAAISAANFSLSYSRQSRQCKM